MATVSTTCHRGQHRSDLSTWLAELGTRLASESRNSAAHTVEQALKGVLSKSDIAETDLQCSQDASKKLEHLQRCLVLQTVIQEVLRFIFQLACKHLAEDLGQILTPGSLCGREVEAGADCFGPGCIHKSVSHTVPLSLPVAGISFTNRFTFLQLFSVSSHRKL